MGERNLEEELNKYLNEQEDTIKDNVLTAISEHCVYNYIKYLTEELSHPKYNYLDRINQFIGFYQEYRENNKSEWTASYLGLLKLNMTILADYYVMKRNGGESDD